MKLKPPLLLGAAVLFASAGVAHATPVRMVVRSVPMEDDRGLASATPRFNLAALHWQGPGMPRFRTRSLSGHWSAWQEGNDDTARGGLWRKGNAIWTGASDAIQVSAKGRVSHVREYLLWSPRVAVPGRRVQLAGSPAIVSRVGWQANEEIRRGGPRYAPVLKLAVVHHTATANAYSCAQSASIVRGIETYHVRGNGWDDIGYNFLVDACGQIFEGRYGGIDKNVIGAHSQGFNTGTTGVSLIGNFSRATPTQAQQSALVKLLAWRLDIAHIDPLSTVSFVSGGNSKFPAGKTVKLRAVSGHRDTYLTECPGAGAYRLLPGLASRVARSGAPKLYAPSVTGSIGGPVRFTGKLSTSLPWTITVTYVTGAVAATWSDFGTAIDWTWDSHLAIPGAAYAWSISAPGVRGATGTFGGKLGALTISSVAVSPPLLSGTVVPTATVSYTLSAPATVTGDLLDAAGLVVRTVFSESKPAGAQSSVFAAGDIPDGNYTVRVTARDALGRQARAVLPVTISRALVSYGADSKVVSPNGDGRHDTVTFHFALAAPAGVALALVSPTATFPFFASELTPGTQSVAFTGKASDGTPVPDGQYLATLSVGAAKVTLPLTVDDAPPVVTLVSLEPLTLRVYEQVTIIATVNGREIRASRPGGLVTLVRGETIETLSVVVRDAAGNESPPLTYPPPRR